MKKFEIIFVIILLTSMLLKILQISAASVFLVLSLFGLTLFYYFFSFALLNGNKLRDISKVEVRLQTNTKRVIGAIVIGFVLSGSLMGPLSVSVGFPCSLGALTQSLCLVIVTFTIILILYFKKKSDYYVNILKRLFLFGFINFIFFIFHSSF